MNRVLFKLVRLPIPWFVRRFLSKILSAFHFGRPIRRSKTNNVDNLKLEQLIDDGYIIINNFLSDKQIDNILARINNFKVYDPWNTSIPDFFSDSPPIETHVAYYKNEDLEKLSPIDEIINSSELSGYLSSYLGERYRCVNKSMWWTYGNKNKAQEAEKFHRDIDNVLWLKAFIYLTDVDINSGPHAYIPKSHRSNKALTFKRFNDSEATKLFGNILYHTGKRGTLILEDTFGLHKGQHINNDEKRLIFQMQFAVLKNPLTSK